MKETRKIEMTQQMIDRYGKINGDNDIIHYDHDYAIARGFRGTLNHGMMTMGYIAELGAKKYGQDWFYKGKLKVKWINPVCPDDLLEIMEDEGQVEASVNEGLVAKGEISLS